MDLSTIDILIGLAAIAVAAAAGAVVYARRTHVADPPEPEPADPGRHHVPRGLLDDPTARLTPEVLAKLRKSQPS